MSADRRREQLVTGLRQQGITDERVLAAIANVPREVFVEEAFADQAYANQALPISCGQTISQPYIVALMTEALKIEPFHRALEIGTGSGYQCAVLSKMCRHVYTVERYRTLADIAHERFVAAGLTNITQRVGDGNEGFPDHAPFERIMVTAAAHEIPEVLCSQLSLGGIMVFPLEERPGKQDLWRLRRHSRGFEREHLLPVRFVPLVRGMPDEG